ncbi:MAG: hypothetical protein EOL87_12120 [Spartobacteria bacterium]|nr:hypothetical protein [Spartobacteria bacterium]
MDHTYGYMEVTGSSAESSDQAVRNAVAAAAEKVSTIRWFEVIQTRGHVVDQAVAHWQVTVKIGYTL